jgi:hypothetical protein
LGTSDVAAEFDGAGGDAEDWVAAAAGGGVTGEVDEPAVIGGVEGVAGTVMTLLRPASRVRARVMALPRSR